MKTFFLSFADTSLTPSLKRIKDQANQMQVFDNILIYNEKNIPNYIKKRIQFVIKQTESKRGYGYWCWKPALINFIIKNEMSDGDLLLYCDAGCDLNPRNRQKLIEYLELTEKKEIIVPQFSNKDYSDNFWTKSDTIALFKGKIIEEKLAEGQIHAAIVFLLINQYTRKIINMWESLMSEYNMHYFDDSPSVIPNHIKFKEHRHDQSILSLLLKSEHYYSLNVEDHFGNGLMNKDQRTYLKTNEPVVSFGNKIKRKRFTQTEFFLCIRYPRYILGKIKNWFYKKKNHD